MLKFTKLDEKQAAVEGESSVGTDGGTKKKGTGIFSGKKKASGAVFKPKKKLTIKKLILMALIAAFMIGGGYGVYRLFFYEEPVEVVNGTTKRDSIATIITGTATLQPTRFQDLTIPVDGTVNEVYVKQGDKVAVGDKLYTIDTTSLNQNIATVESNIANYQSQLNTYNKNLSNLTITAPFTGKLLNTTTSLVGDQINSGAAIATIVDDSKMKLSLYFSNAYQGNIKVGMAADVSVPQYMSTMAGTVTSIDNVSYVTSEGTVCFKVTITVDNPGSLTKGLTATATINSNGMSMSPANSGTLDYNQTKTVSAQVSGTLAKLNVQDSLKVTSGDVLAVITNEDYANQISMLEKQLSSAQLNLENLKTELSECSPTATVAGTVIFVKIESGDEVSSGTTAMAIYNTDEMKIEAQINESQNDYITEGMTVTITKGSSSSSSSSSERQSAKAMGTASGSAASLSSSSNTFTGTVTKKSLQASSSNGVAYFPTTITIESGGTLSPGIYVTYTITAAQASDVVLAPIAAIQQTTAGTCLFIKSDTKPENAVDLADGIVPDGYYAVKVTTGLTSNSYVEIKSGVDENVTVFERYVKKNTTSGSDQTSQSTANTTTQQSGQGQWQQGGPPSGFGGGPMGG